MSSLNKVFNELSSSETKGSGTTSSLNKVFNELSSSETKGTGTIKTILQELMQEQCRSASIS